jgi:outer membrane protein assembly factor BamA
MRAIPFWILVGLTLLSTSETRAQEAAEARDVLNQDPATTAAVDSILGTSITPLPVIFYSPETQLAFGGAATILYRAEGSTLRDRPSTFTPALIYTTRGQVLFFLGGSVYGAGNRDELSPGLSYRKFPDSFYGIGNDTDADGGQDYTDEGWTVYADYQHELVSRWRAGAGMNFANSSITGTQATDMLETENIPGQMGGQVVGIGFLGGWDGRDNISFPRRGQYHQLSVRVHDEAWGSDFDFTLSSLDLRAYLPLARSSTVALRALGQSSSGEVPFQTMPALGGDQLLRGYYAGRFRDNALLAVQGELRLHVWRRMGMVVFGAAGQVAPELSGLGMGRFHGSLGAGLRMLLVRDEGLNLRCDYGIGSDSTGLYFSLGEAF